ncbi:MAG: NAD+ synthase [Nitrosopumilaceae archaeon]
MNQDILNEILNQDYRTAQNKIEKFLVQEVRERDSDGVIFGLSGGIDSAVIAFLCANVLKEKSVGMIMPDTKVSPKQDTEDALKIVDKLGLEYKLIDINPIHTNYSMYLEPNNLALGNLRARIRANILYYYANAKKYLVLGSSDKSEFLIGYFTKYGDGSADLLPIISLYKTQIRQFAKFLGVPESIISKKSSPNLWEGHEAEAELGVTYEEIDSILYCIVDKKKTTEETVTLTEIDKQTVNKIYQLYKKSEHKRITPKKA